MVATRFISKSMECDHVLLSNYYGARPTHLDMISFNPNLAHADWAGHGYQHKEAKMETQVDSPRSQRGKVRGEI